MSVGLLDRVRRVARRSQRFHQPQGDRRAVGIRGQEPLPPIGGAGRIARTFRLPGQRLQRLGVEVGQARTLRLQPIFELS